MKLILEKNISIGSSHATAAELLRANLRASCDRTTVAPESILAALTERTSTWTTKTLDHRPSKMYCC